VDVRPPAEPSVLRLVVGPLHVVDAGTEADGTPKVLAAGLGRGQAGELGEAVERQVDLPRGPPELEPADLPFELRIERAGLQEVQQGPADVGAGQNRRGLDLLAGFQHDAGGPSGPGQDPSHWGRLANRRARPATPSHWRGSRRPGSGGVIASNGLTNRAMSTMSLPYSS